MTIDQDHDYRLHVRSFLLMLALILMVIGIERDDDGLLFLYILYNFKRYKYYDDKPHFIWFVVIIV